MDPRGMGPDPPKRPKALDFELCGNAGANQQKNGAVGNESRPFRGTHVGQRSRIMKRRAKKRKRMK